MTAFTSTLDACVPSAIASINWFLVILAMMDSFVEAQNDLKRMSYAGCVTLFKTRQSYAARLSFMPMVMKSPGLKPIEAQNARSRSARVPYTASQATASAWFSSWACFESGRINQSVRTAASQVMRSARRRLPARKPNAMAIPQQTIKILGTPVLGEDHAFDWHAESFYIKADGGDPPPLAER